MDEDAIGGVVDALARGINAVEYPIGVVPGSYDWDTMESLPANRAYIQMLAQAALVELARHYAFTTVLQMLDVLDRQQEKGTGNG